MRFGPLPRMMTFLRSVGARFVLLFVGRVEIRREALKLGGAGIHALVHRRVTLVLACADWCIFSLAALPFFTFQQLRRAARRRSPCASIAQLVRRRSIGCESQLGLHVRDFFQLMQEPGIDLGHLRRSLAPSCPAQRVANVLQPLGVRRDQPLGEDARLNLFGADASCRFPASGRPSASASLKVRPMAMTSPTDFICGPSDSSAPGNFSNCHLGILTTT